MHIITCKTCGKKWNANTEEEVNELVKVYPCGCPSSEQELVHKKIG